MFGLNSKKMHKLINCLLHAIAIILFPLALSMYNEWTIIILCFGLLFVMIAYLLLQILQRLDRYEPTMSYCAST